MGRDMKTNRLPVESSEPSKEELYICIAPKEGQLVYRYFNSFLPEEKARRFEENLLLCFRCQDIIWELDELFEILQRYRDDLFQKPGQETEKHEVEENSSSMARVNSHT